MLRSPERIVALVLALVAVAAVVFLLTRGGAEPTPPVAETTPTPTATAEPDATAGLDPARLDAPRVFADGSFWNARLPDDIAFERRALTVDGEGKPVNPTVAAELQAFATKPDGGSNTYVNFRSYTARITVVPADEPLQPVKLCRFSDDCVPSYAGSLDQMMRGLDGEGEYAGGGFPVPDDVVLPEADDTDAAAVFYQPGYRGPNGERGRVFEAWKFRANPDFDPDSPVSPENTRYTAAFGGRMVGVDGEGPGYYRDLVGSGSAPFGGPDATGESSYWGVTATGMPMVASQMTLADCVRGRLDHGIGIQVPLARQNSTFWPARRNDGRDPDAVVSEGMRVTFPRGAKPPEDLTAVGRAVWQAAYDYGLVVDDQTASTLNFRAEPGCERTELFRSADVPTYEQLRNFPWRQMRVIAEGSDETPNPTR